MFSRFGCNYIEAGKYLEKIFLCWEYERNHPIPRNLPVKTGPETHAGEKDNSNMEKSQLLLLKEFVTEQRSKGIWYNP